MLTKVSSSVWIVSDKLMVIEENDADTYQLTFIFASAVFEKRQNTKNDNIKTYMTDYKRRNATMTKIAIAVTKDKLY